MTYKKGKLIFKDFATDFGGDCFSIAMEQYNCNYYDALRHIAVDFNLIKGKGKPVPKKDYSHLEKERAQAELSEIKIKVRKWKKVDKEYWYDRFGLTRETLKKYGVYPVEIAWHNDFIVYNAGMYVEQDPCYAYRLGKGEYKLYFPLRAKDDFRTRFMHNTQRVQGYRQLPKTGKFLVMTKSMKDVMVLATYGIDAIALPSETVYPQEGLMVKLKERFDHILSLYDYDRAGIKMANYLKRKYGVTVLMLLPQETGAKDISEFVEKHGRSETEKLITSVSEHIDIYFHERSELKPF